MYKYKGIVSLNISLKEGYSITFHGNKNLLTFIHPTYIQKELLLRFIKIPFNLIVICFWLTQPKSLSTKIILYPKTPHFVFFISILVIVNPLLILGQYSLTRNI